MGEIEKLGTLERGQETGKDRDQSTEVGRQRIMQINSAKDLKVYQKAYTLAIHIFKISRR